MLFVFLPIFSEPPLFSPRAETKYAWCVVRSHASTRLHYAAEYHLRHATPTVSVYGHATPRQNRCFFSPPSAAEFHRRWSLH
jgi:hypothetical protein